jgi:hypothetical protein
MAKLQPAEREALREFAKQKRLQQIPAPALPVSEYLRSLSTLPPSLSPPKQVKFVGTHWRL